MHLVVRSTDSVPFSESGACTHETTSRRSYLGSDPRTFLSSLLPAFSPFDRWPSRFSHALRLWGLGPGSSAMAVPDHQPSEPASMTDRLPPGVERMLVDAAARGLEVQIVSRQPAGNLPEAAKLLGIQTHEIIKSLVVRHKDGTFLFVLVPGDRVISWPKLRSLLGVNRLSLPNSDVAFSATGYERGTITALGSSTQWPVYADFGVEQGRVCIGAGGHGHSAFVKSTELIAALDATVADISDPEPEPRASS